MLVVPWLSASRPGPSTPPTALLIDRQPLFLAAIAQLLSGPPIHARVEVFTRSDAILDRIAASPVDLVLADVQATPVSGPELAIRVARDAGSSRVVLLGEREAEPLMIEALACGAVGFFSKHASAEEFLEGVQAILAGHAVLSRELAGRALDRLAARGDGDPFHVLDRLSPVERSIFVMIGQAQSIRVIASTRGISQKTVRNHLASIYRKLQLRNRSEIIRWSARAGLIGAPTEP